MEVGSARKERNLISLTIHLNSRIIIDLLHLITRYSGVRVIASRILHEICLLVGELAIRGTKLSLNARLGTKSNLLIEQYCY